MKRHVLKSNILKYFIVSYTVEMSRVMRKPTFCVCENSLVCVRPGQNPTLLVFSRCGLVEIDVTKLQLVLLRNEPQREKTNNVDSDQV